MSNSKPTSNDVARLAGVSQSTVSRSFDPESPISAETRERVLAAAAELGYQPNAIARSLITQRTNIIGIVMANLTDSQFYPNVLEQFTHRLQDMGKQVLLLTTPPGRSVDEMLTQILGYQVDALIIASLTPGNEIINFSNRGGRPVIMFNRYATGTNANVVCCDNVDGGRQVADYLLDTGHNRIAYVAGPENTTTNLMREKGFTEQLNQRGYHDILREQAEYRYVAGRQAAHRLLAGDDRPDAVFCAADIIALGLMDAARYDLGIRVPDDLSVVGFDDVASAGWPAYDLTTIRQPVDEMITATLELLKQADQGDQEPKTTLLPVELVVRGSTKS
jgi:DNA-binding LacI/PurR family transcriptional regulator